jgi:hypothetical protein
MPERADYSEDTDVSEEFHLARSFWRRATTRAQLLVDVPEVVVECWVNRWGTGTAILVKGPMRRIIYSERNLMLEH